MSGRIKDEHLAEHMECLLRHSGNLEELQDLLAVSLQWAEGEQMKPAVLKAMEARAKGIVGDFLRAKAPVPDQELKTIVDAVSISDSGQGVAHINLPQEVRAWLLHRSKISF